jgi:hypothetical protein
MRPSIYIETTIVSYLTGRPARELILAAHQQITQDWWEQRGGEFDLFISQQVLGEAGAGDPQAARKRLDALAGLRLLDINDAVLMLAQELIDDGAVPAEAKEDALHIAAAAVHGVDYLLTWNCAHIANAQMRDRMEAVCLAAGYEPPIICTPEELMEA